MDITTGHWEEANPGREWKFIIDGGEYAWVYKLGDGRFRWISESYTGRATTLEFAQEDALLHLKEIP